MNRPLVAARSHLFPVDASSVRDAVLFDLDGTLAETHWDIAASTDFVLASFGLPVVGPDAIPDYVGLGLEHLLTTALAGAATPERLAEARRRYVEHHAAHCCDRVRLYDGIEAFLEALARSGRRLGLLSNKPTAFCEQILIATGVRKYFGIVYGSDATPWMKPDGRGLVRLAEELGAKRPLYIGDSSIDIDAARAAGFRVGFVTWGYGKIENEKPDFIWNTVGEMVRCLLGPLNASSAGTLESNLKSKI